MFPIGFLLVDENGAEPLIKHYSTFIKRPWTLRIGCSSEQYREFLNNNLIWLKEAEGSASNSYDLKTIISKLPVLDDSFINSIVQDYDQIGYNLFIKNSSVVCLHGNWLLWRYEIFQKERIHIDIYYTDKIDNYFTRMARKLLGRVSPGEIKRERLLYITRIGIHFPMFLLLKTEENIDVMHGAAVTRDGKTIILTGFDGIGKSTLAMFLCLQHNFQYVADNFLLHDDKYVYSFPESPRLNEDSLKSLGIFANDKIHKRSTIIPKKYHAQSLLKVSAIFFNIISNKDSIEEITAHQLTKKLLNMQDYLPEFIEYKQFLSIARLIEKSQIIRASESNLKDLLKNCKLFLLKKNKMSNISNLAEFITGCI